MPLARREDSTTLEELEIGLVALGCVPPGVEAFSWLTAPEPLGAAGCVASLPLAPDSTLPVVPLVPVSILPEVEVEGESTSSTVPLGALPPQPGLLTERQAPASTDTEPAGVSAPVETVASVSDVTGTGAETSVVLVAVVSVPVVARSVCSETVGLVSVTVVVGDPGSGEGSTDVVVVEVVC